MPKDTSVPEGWPLLSVPYPSSTISPPAGQRVKLLGVRAGDDPPEVVSDKAVVVVEADNQLVVALPREEATRASSYLGGSVSSISPRSDEVPKQRMLQVVLKTGDKQIRTH